MDTMFLKEALFYGASANAFKLGTVLTGGWFWVRVTGCTLLYRGEDISSIDFNKVLAVGEIDAGQLQPPAYISHDSNSVYFYVVRRANNFGMAEQTFSTAVKVSIDADGNLTLPRPNGIFAVKAKQFAPGQVQLVWFYCPLEQKSKPVCFKIYSDNGTGQINYENPPATVSYAGQRFYSYTSNVLDMGTYLFAIKAEDSAGVQSLPAQIRIQVSNVTSEMVTILETQVT